MVPHQPGGDAGPLRYLADAGHLDPPLGIQLEGRQAHRYKQPREVTVLDGLPKNATGKILRRELRQG
ncbi:hypothetical protein [Micrococcus aloeverae]|nr:hypothetical protein [Micrococcus luteus]